MIENISNLTLLLSLGFILVALPVSLSVSLQSPGDRPISLNVEGLLFFGLFCLGWEKCQKNKKIYIKIFSLVIGRLILAEKPKVSKKKSKKPSKTPISFKYQFQRSKKILAYSRDHRKNFIKMIRNIWLFTWIDRLRGRVRFGFADPVITGEVVGGIWTLSEPLSKHLELDFEADFTQAFFGGRLRGRLWFLPLGWLLVALFYLPILAWSFRRTVWVPLRSVS